MIWEQRQHQNVQGGGTPEPELRNPILYVIIIKKKKLETLFFNPFNAQFEKSGILRSISLFISLYESGGIKRKVLRLGGC